MPAPPRMSAGAYLSRMATARPVYMALFKAAMGVLAPPADTCRADPIECGLAATVIAKQLGLSPSVVREEVRRLESHGWVMRKGRRLYLGQRVGTSPYLLSDVKAEEATAEAGLVLREVLGWSAATEQTGGVGTRRRWQR